MKADLKDTTFILSSRLDSIERLENILAVVNYFSSVFDTNIHVGESNYTNNTILQRLLPSNVVYTYIKDEDPVFHRTKLTNKMIRAIDTEIISIWDVDAIASASQIVESVEMLRNNLADLVYPYQKKLLDVSYVLRELFFESKNIDILYKHQNKMKPMYPPVSVGGAYFCRREDYLKIGLENEDFYGWGAEDGERYGRFEGYGYKVGRVEGVLFHLTHPRLSNSLMSHRDDFSSKLFFMKKSIRHSNSINKKETAL